MTVSIGLLVHVILSPGSHAGKDRSQGAAAIRQGVFHFRWNLTVHLPVDEAVGSQFPLWWFSMPAILKGWVERIFAFGFAYGVGVHEGEHWGDRYGEGRLTGRRAMLSTTMGGRAPHYALFGARRQRGAG